MYYLLVNFAVVDCNKGNNFITNQDFFFEKGQKIIVLKTTPGKQKNIFNSLSAVFATKKRGLFQKTAPFSNLFSY